MDHSGRCTFSRSRLHSASRPGARWGNNGGIPRCPRGDSPHPRTARVLKKLRTRCAPDRRRRGGRLHARRTGQGRDLCALQVLIRSGTARQRAKSRDGAPRRVAAARATWPRRPTAMRQMRLAGPCFATARTAERASSGAASRSMSTPQPSRPAAMGGRSMSGGTTSQAPRPREPASRFPTRTEAELLPYVTRIYRETCERAGAGPADVAASIACDPPRGADRVWYVLFDDRSRLENYYEKRLKEVDPGPGSCSAHGSAPGRSTYADGRRLCYRIDDEAWIEWTDTELNVYSFARRDGRTDKTLPTLFRWWEQVPGPERE